MAAQVYEQCFAGVTQRLRSGSAGKRWRKPQAHARKLSKRRVRMRKQSNLESMPAITQNGASTDPQRTSKTEEQRRLMKDAMIANTILNPMVSDLSPVSMNLLIDLACPRNVQSGEIIIKQGESSNGSLWIVGEGEVEVLVHAKRESTISAGSCFGELNCLNLTPRAVTVASLRKSLLWEFKSDCLALVHAEPLKKKLEGYAAALSQAELFRSKSQEVLQIVADLLSEQTLQKDDYVFREGEEATTAYLLWDGELVLEIDGQEHSRLARNPSVNLVPFFGSSALFVCRRIRTMSCRVSSDKAVLLALDRQSYLCALRFMIELQDRTSNERWLRLRTSMRSTFRNRHENFKRIIGQVEHFKWLPEDLKDELSRKIQRRIYLKDEYVFREGDRVDACYVMIKGAASILVNGREMSRMVGNVETSRTLVFGSTSMRERCFRKISILVTSETLEVFVVPDEVYREAVGMAATQSTSGLPVDVHMCRGLLMEYRPQDLVELGLLGIGGFGSVTLVEHKPTGHRFALKALSKGYIMAQHMHDCVMNERNILRMIDSPFLLRAVAFFNSPQRVLLLTELALGGDLYEICEKHGLFGKQEECRFFLACVMRALEHLHALHIIYRDIKPENLLLDCSGYLKMTHFGFAKLVVGRTSTMCGTPHYFAPEIVVGVPYDLSVDWWAFGVLVFELNTGKTPFEADEPQQIFSNIRCGISVVTFPYNSELWSDLVRQLCSTTPSDRLPMRRGGIRNIELHPWYDQNGKEVDTFDWASFSLRTMKAPFVPEVKTCEQTRNFPQDVVTEPPTMAFAKWKDQWKSFENRWGPCLWGEPEDDPRSSTPAVKSGSDRHTCPPSPKRRQPVFPLPPSLTAPEFGGKSSPKDDEDPGVSRGMPRTSPRVLMPASLGDVDEPEEAICEPDGCEDVTEEELMGSDFTDDSLGERPHEDFSKSEPPFDRQDTAHDEVLSPTSFTLAERPADEHLSPTSDSSAPTTYVALTERPADEHLSATSDSSAPTTYRSDLQNLGNAYGSQCSAKTLESSAKTLDHLEIEALHTSLDTAAEFSALRDDVASDGQCGKSIQFIDEIKPSRELSSAVSPGGDVTIDAVHANIGGQCGVDQMDAIVTEEASNVVEEERISEDGTASSKREFSEEFRPESGQQSWDSAKLSKPETPPQTTEEERIAEDEEPSAKLKFMGELTPQPGQLAWDSPKLSKPETPSQEERIAEDEEPSTKLKFMGELTPQPGQLAWDSPKLSKPETPSQASPTGADRMSRVLNSIKIAHGAEDEMFSGRASRPVGHTNSETEHDAVHVVFSPKLEDKVARVQLDTTPPRKSMDAVKFWESASRVAAVGDSSKMDKAIDGGTELGPSSRLIFSPKPGSAYVPRNAPQLQSPGFVYKPPLRQDREHIEEIVLSEIPPPAINEVLLEDAPLPISPSQAKQHSTAVGITLGGAQTPNASFMDVDLRVEGSSASDAPATARHFGHTVVRKASKASFDTVGSDGSTRALDIVSLAATIKHQLAGPADSMSSANNTNTVTLVNTPKLGERVCRTLPQSPVSRSRTASGVTASPMSTFRDLNSVPVSFATGLPQSPKFVPPARNTPGVPVFVTKFTAASTTSMASSPQHHCRSIGPEAGSASPGYRQARPPKAVGSLVPPVTTRKQIIFKDATSTPTITPSSTPGMSSRSVQDSNSVGGLSSSGLSSRISRLSAPPSTSIPQSPGMRSRIVNPEPASPMMGNRTMREPPQTAPRPIQVNTFSTVTTTRPATSLGSPVGYSVGPARVIRNPRRSKVQPSMAPGTHSGQATPQGTPSVRTRSPLRVGMQPQPTPTPSHQPSHQPGHQSPTHAPRNPGAFTQHTHPLTRSPATPQSMFSHNLRVAPSQAGDVTAAAIVAGLGHTTPRGSASQ